MMTKSHVTAAAILAMGLGFAASPARADDAAACDKGIEMITAEIAKQHPKPVADKLATALRVAKREKGEKEYDECLDAVGDATKALKQ